MNLSGLILIVLNLGILLENYSLGFHYEDDDAIYDFHKERNSKIGSGAIAQVLIGNRTMGRNTDAAAFKMAIYESSEPYLLQEKNMFELMKEHESIPKFYKFIPATIKSGIILVIELLGENLSKLLNKHKYFTIHTSLKIGLQALDALEHIHKHNVIHFDVAARNLALDIKNDSRIYLFDFDLSLEYEIVNDCVVMKGPLLDLESYKEFVSKKTKSPKQDLIDLAVTINQFLGERILNESQSELTRKQLQDIYERQEIMNLISNYKVKMLTSRSIYPDYEALRKILGTELDKHRNVLNFDKFDWQIIE